ncbi:MAG: 30S ribosomal protein S6 [Acidimicrobiales bacterium]
MRAYELAVILDGDLEDHIAQAWQKTITQAIKSNGGSVVGSPEWWGKRRLAYPIKKRNEGYYMFFNVVASGGAMDEVERTLRLADQVIRHKLLRLPDSEAERRGMVAAAG